MNDDEQYQAAFGEHTGLSDHCRFMIDKIKRNFINFDILRLIELGIGGFPNLAWKLLGRYIANNTHLTILDLRHCRISNEKVALLFGELVGSGSLESVDLDNNEFGIEGLRHMLPFLMNSPKLEDLHFRRNNNFDTECFEVLVSTLYRVSSKLKHLSISYCNITDISALESYNLPDLQKLVLSSNSIGREGCISLANILQNEGSTLTDLFLDNTGMGDEEAELLATSLKHNTKLEILSITNNNITERGKGAFLKLLVDASSIENVFNSNHTLISLTLIDLTLDVLGITRNDETDRHIKSALNMNETNRNYEATGRAKVITYQLNSQNRKDVCHLQGVEYSSIGNLFADIEPTLLPRILALIGRECGQSEFYTSLTPMVPDLMSYIDRRALIDDIIAKNSRDFADLEAEYARQKREYARKKLALTKKRDELHNRRACIDSKAGIQGKDEGEPKVTRADARGKSKSDEQKAMNCGGKKRRI